MSSTQKRVLRGAQKGKSLRYSSHFTFKEYLKALGHDSLVETLDDYHLGAEISESSHQRLLDDFDLYLKTGGLPAVIDSRLSGGNWRDTILDIPHEIEKGDIRIHSLPAYLSDEISRLVSSSSPP